MKNLFNKTSKLKPGADAVVKKRETEAEDKKDIAASRDAIVRKGAVAWEGSVTREQAVTMEGAVAQKGAVVIKGAVVNKLNKDEDIEAIGATKIGAKASKAEASSAKVSKAMQDKFKLEVVRAKVEKRKEDSTNSAKGMHLTGKPVAATERKEVAAVSGGIKDKGVLLSKDILPICIKKETRRRRTIKKPKHSY